jgi:hypothetical protein
MVRFYARRKNNYERDNRPSRALKLTTLISICLSAQTAVGVTVEVLGCKRTNRGHEWIRNVLPFSSGSEGRRPQMHVAEVGRFQVLGDGSQESGNCPHLCL